MITTTNPRPRPRRLAIVAAGVTLSLTPLVAVSDTASADRPAVVVTGLQRGARGEAVESVQQALVDEGHPVTGGVDGVFGSGTERALKAFQQRHGLNATGIVDDATAVALGLSQNSMFGLTRGSRGEAVRKLQQQLVNAGMTVAGGVDGVFGPGTARAVATFQRSVGYSPTGVVNAATASALASVDGPVASVSEPEPEETADAAATTGEDAAASSSATPLAGLRIGSRGNDVKTLQRKLMGAGFTVVGGADGIFGALTANAVKSFQNANGLDVSGAIDDATAKVLAGLGDEPAPATPATPTVSNPFVGLRYGSLGADVKSLQTALLNAGISLRGGADGVFGFATQAAVKQYQSQHGLEQTGKVDEKTASVLSSGASAASGSSMTGLKAGALGNTVKKLQQAMIDAGVTVRGGADGIFGPATANALKQFQTSQGLQATGVVDDATAAALANPKKPVPSVGSPNQSATGFAAYGEKGSRVIALQSALVNAGISVRGGVDGDFGGGTAAAVMAFQRANGLTVTGKVSDATAEKLGLERLPEPKAPDPSSVRLAAFPVEGPCYYGDSWGFRRGGGRVHLGVDIMAAKGQELYAVADGTITKLYVDYPGALAGNGVRLTMADGTYFFYAHMDVVADGIAVGSKVKAGQVLGTVGNTGNSGANHLHLEIHPQGGSAINPYPLVKAIDAC